MSILIKDLEVPADGNTLLCIISSDGSVNYKHHREKNWKLGEAISVPPHGRLIDADALMKTCGMANDCYSCPNGSHGWCTRSQDAANICEDIEDAPTIIPGERRDT